MSDVLLAEREPARVRAVPLAAPPAAAIPGSPAPSTGEPRGRRPRSRRLRPARAHVSVALAALVVLTVIGFAFLPSVFATGDPLAGVPADKLRPPGPQHWFGTDNIGRDLYTRVVYGARLSLTATLIAVTIALVAGTLIGLLAGTVGGAVDIVLMRIVDVMLSIPSLLLSLALVTALGFGTVNVAIAVGVAMIAGFARVTRSEVLRVRRAPYVEAAFASGVRWWTVLGRHILRNSYGPVISLAAVEFGMAILAVSALSFLGFGSAPPAPEWGSMISEGRDFLSVAWWMTTLPGLVIIAVVLSAHHLGHSLSGRNRS